jgi:regulator of protease activity HflC (stomatin/prohibitin superfamily)
VENWGIEVTRAEILDVNLDQATRDAMLQQLNAERARRAAVTEAEGKKRAVELSADAELYASEQTAKARRILAEAEAYATQVVAQAINENGLEAAQYQIALKQVEALSGLGSGAGNQTLVLPSNAVDAFVDAFKLLKGRARDGLADGLVGLDRARAGARDRGGPAAVLLLPGLFAGRAVMVGLLLALTPAFWPGCPRRR